MHSAGRFVCAAAMTLMLELLLSMTATASARVPGAAAAIDASVEQPRPFGYIVGDVLAQRVLLQVGGRRVEPVSLPSPGRSSAWFTRRRVSIAPDSQGRRWLVITYQIVNAPRSVASVSLPAWELALQNGAPTLHVPAWRITVSPLTPAPPGGSASTGDLRPDRGPPSAPVGTIRRHLQLSSGALGATVIAWVGWIAWRNRRAATREPFARALRVIGGLEDSSPPAWQALHRAFDATAGRVVQPATLPALFAHAPQLLPLRADIERFYAQSAEMFFGGGSPKGDRLSPRELCTRLRRLERRYER